MRNLVKSHFAYIFNKTTLYILFIVLLVTLLINIVSISSVNESSSYQDNNNYYFYNSFLSIKLLVTFLAIFIYSYPFTIKLDQYAYLILTSNISRIKYFTTKIFTITLMLTVFVWIQYFIYLVVGYFGYNKYFFNIDNLIAYLNMFLLICFYGGISLLLIQLSNNIYTIIVPFSIMNLGSIINESKSDTLYKVYNLFFPNFINETSDFVFGYYHIILNIILIYIFNILIYQNKDFK